MVSLTGTGRLADDVYLLAHHEVCGRPFLQPRALGLGLAGALLAELVLAGKILIRPDEVIVAGFAACRDQLTQRVMGLVLREFEGHPVRDWLAFLARTTPREVAGRLEASENAVIDRLALAQIWPRLRPVHQKTLAALTAYHDYGLAAAALGISRTWFTTRLSAARREFLALWHESEPLPQLWAQGQRGNKTTDRLQAQTGSSPHAAAPARNRRIRSLPGRGRPAQSRPAHQPRRTGQPLPGRRVHPPARRVPRHLLQHRAQPLQSRRHPAPPRQRPAHRS